MFSLSTEHLILALDFLMGALYHLGTSPPIPGCWEFIWLFFQVLFLHLFKMIIFFLLCSVNVVNYMTDFQMLDKLLDSWDRSLLVMICYFYILLDSFCQYFLRDFHICVHVGLFCNFSYRKCSCLTWSHWTSWVVFPLPLFLKKSM